MDQTLGQHFYVYAYLREDCSPYYVGKGSGRRRFKRGGRPCPVPSDETRIIVLAENLIEAEAFRLEVLLIAFWGRKDLGTGRLHNQSDGGTGTTGRIITAEMRARLSAVNTGKRHTAEARLKISAAGTGRVRSAEAKAKTGAARRGVPLSAEHRAKLAEAKRGKPRTALTRAKISAARRGKPKSPETRARMSEAAKIREAARRSERELAIQPTSTAQPSLLPSTVQRLSNSL
jgi:hypothetical protein